MEGSCVLLYGGWWLGSLKAVLPYVHFLVTGFFMALLTAELNNGLKKEVSSKDVARIWVNEDLKMRSFSPTNVSLCLITNYQAVSFTKQWLIIL